MGGANRLARFGGPEMASGLWVVGAPDWPTLYHTGASKHDTTL